ncbi:hypothetical protein A2356_03730 [Candidatus Nomurabacteria bacterium RIFOXYB1_FULL_39_16]|uniref:Phosphatidylglycerol lysyltransferase C-terminal domain-containing protein n=2 Tax=Candidatus Nomuraibacteriota TaxID=1752729 RepID=A0A0G0QWV6_9BACT|nr:MAG: hypothetical protein UT78_C0019G0016 [Candidatus Nomurabacteria bacterium GW2011_GWF2_40_12]OGJ09191.1 MAG: hypothetical protein A2356_03730 [Candidatus Nomurabacteria bacterium RIFOXYB1_FULL_39_16]OGJ15100.1 MAG: hypothetical protein A2585_00680 [Candidatus Nomurabacteria bacterium RIFOXYD1_FULL_39_12]
MIPEFPNFKKLELTDKEEVEKFTSKFPPYSDFNFTSLWAWDTNGKRMISKLNGNLVVQFTDYETCEPFFSFLGTNKPEHTARELIHFAEKSGVSSTLRFVPEESIKDLLKSDLLVEEDRDNFDYIFSVSELASLRGIKFKEKRHSADGFLREYPDARFEFKELGDTVIREQIVAVFHSWINKKELDKKAYDFEQEEIAIKRSLKTASQQGLVVSCIYLHDIMIGFSIDEILPFQYSISHFIKADITHQGIYDFLNRKLAQYLSSQGIAYWNWEQDLGIEYIKKSKTSYRPVNFLKKYKVSLINKK